MVAIKNVLFFVAAANALVVPRTVAAIKTDITTIDSDVKTLTTDAKAYNGGISPALKVQTDSDNLDKAIQQGTKDAQATSQASSADSKAVISQVNGIIPDIEAALNAVVAKKANFAADGLTGTVKNDLNELKTDTDSFANALIAIASSDQKSAGQSAKSKIDTDFSNAIAQFS